MLHSYLEHMKKMIDVAEEISKILNPGYYDIHMSPRAAKIINAINKGRTPRKNKT